jgi:hypothetical protein
MVSEERVHMCACKCVCAYVYLTAEHTAADCHWRVFAWASVSRSCRTPAYCPHCSRSDTPGTSTVCVCMSV